MSTTNPTSQKIQSLSKAPLHRGAIFQMEADEQGLVFLDAKDKSLKVYLLVDPETDRVIEVKFFTYGGPVYTAVAETLCQILDQAPLGEACQTKAGEVEKRLRDEEETPVLAEDATELSTIEPILEHLISKYPQHKISAQALVEARKKQTGEHRSVFEIRTEQDKEWAAMSKEVRIEKIDQCLTEHVRQGLNMDGGDIEVLDLVDEIKVIAKYQGACGSCGAATGGTLFYIEDTLRKHIHPALRVEPQGLSF